MLKKQKSEEQNESYLHKKVDPELEAKVDALMSTDIPKQKQETKSEISQTPPSYSSAPLLPNDKLPNFDKNNNYHEPIKESDTIIKKIDANDPIDLSSSRAKMADEIGIEDRATEQAVDDIVADESNRIIAIEDAKAEIGESLKKKGFLKSIKAKLLDFWANPIARNMSIFLTVAVILIVAIIPVSRYFALNILGIRASMSVKILDDQTSQPLKNVEVSIGGISSKTDIDGFVRIDKVKLGKQILTAKKPAFATSERTITIGLGSNPLEDSKLIAVGSRYSFEITDYISGKPVDAEAISKESSARADNSGKIALVVEDEKEDKVIVEIVAKNYRTEKLSLDVGSQDLKKIELVPAKKHAFISKRDGKYDLYKTYIDGKNEEKVLAGTGRENEDNMVILPHKTKNIVAFVSSRGNKFNQDGYALSSLNIVNLDTDKSKEIAVSERIQLVDFIDNRLVYVSIAQGASASSSDRHKLISYDVDNGDIKELAKANYFNDVMSAKGFIYYSPSGYKSNDKQLGLYEVKPDGSEKTTIYSKEVWNLFRTSYYKIAVSVQQTWYEYDTGSAQFAKLEGSPAELKSRVYVDSPDSKLTVWSEDRDGKGTLLIYNPDTNEADKVLVSQIGLRNPVYWLDDDHIVYRVSADNEIADYIVSVSGGEPRKITNVTNTAGIDRWYYY